MEYAFHEVADIFPLMQGEEFAHLVNDIREYGLREPIWVYDDKIIDGRNRYRACEEAGVEPEFREWDGEGSAVAFVVSLNLHRRHLDESQRGLVAGKIAQLQHGGDRRSDDFQDSNLNLENAARMLNVSRTTAAYGKKVADEGSLILVSKVESGEVAVSTAAEIADLDEEEQKAVLLSGETEILRAAARIKREKKQKRQAERAQRREHIPDDLPAFSDRYETHQADVASLTFLPDNSIDCIITDPPYPEEFLSVYGALGMTARRVLKPGGSCIVMVGQSYLPSIVAQLSEHLTYHWCIAYLTPGGQSAQLWQRKVNTFWKPLLWFVKGDYSGDWVGDVTRSEPNDNDKRFHWWGQSESGMADIIRRFSAVGQTVLDPFCGGGTTGQVALDLGRRFIGADIDADAVQTTRVRLAEQEDTHAA